ncbi:putative beta-carotene-binding protein [Osmia lignaria lignaria]|uniref:putative beta-carotene-binding protein n=1 Tax=Osmia lignaria lignaria TaxID=1437193 RepID=UPI0014797C8E|nr:uncharacterized protein LOC117607176 [Osmia lignaria]
MFSNQLLFLMTVIGMAVAEVPSYIHVCGRKDPKLDECVINSVKSLRDKLRDGIPELDIPPVEPLKMSKVELIDTPSFKATATDIILRGLLTYHVNFLHVDLKKQQIDIDVYFEENKLDAHFNITAQILVPIVGKGPISLVAKNVAAKANLNFKLVDHAGKKYVFFPSMTTNLDVKNYDLKFEAENFDNSLHDAISQALGNSRQEILDAVKPNLEKVISETVLSMANKIGKHFTYDELLPDRE